MSDFVSKMFETFENGFFLRFYVVGAIQKKRRVASPKFGHTLEEIYKNTIRQENKRLGICFAYADKLCSEIETSSGDESCRKREDWLKNLK